MDADLVLAPVTVLGDENSLAAALPPSLRFGQLRFDAIDLDRLSFRGRDMGRIRANGHLASPVVKR